MFFIIKLGSHFVSEYCGYKMKTIEFACKAKFYDYMGDAMRVASDINITLGKPVARVKIVWDE